MHKRSIKYSILFSLFFSCATIPTKTSVQNYFSAHTSAPRVGTEVLLPFNPAEARLEKFNYFLTISDLHAPEQQKSFMIYLDFPSGDFNALKHQALKEKMNEILNRIKFEILKLNREIDKADNLLRRNLLTEHQKKLIALVPQLNRQKSSMSDWLDIAVDERKDFPFQTVPKVKDSANLPVVEQPAFNIANFRNNNPMRDFTIFNYFFDINDLNVPVQRMYFVNYLNLTPRNFIHISLRQFLNSMNDIYASCEQQIAALEENKKNPKTIATDDGQKTLQARIDLLKRHQQKLIDLLATLNRELLPRTDAKEILFDRTQGIRPFK